MSTSSWSQPAGSRRWLLVMTLLGTSLLFLAACDTNDNGGAPAATIPTIAAVEQTATPGPEQQETAEIGGVIAEEDVRQVVNAWAALDSYRVEGEMTRSSTNESAITMSLRARPPDRQHLTVTMGEQTFELIAIGSTNYAKFGSAWMQIPGGAGSMGSLPLNPNEFLQEIETLESMSLPDHVMTRTGIETIDGVECEIWQMATEQNAVASRFWIGTDDRLPRQIEAGSGEGTVLLTISDFNGQFSIEPPI